MPELAQAEVRFADAFASGFAETGADGAAAQERLASQDTRAARSTPSRSWAYASRTGHPPATSRHLTLHRPESLNAIIPDLREQLIERLAKASADPPPVEGT